MPSVFSTSIADTVGISNGKVDTKLVHSGATTWRKNIADTVGITDVTVSFFTRATPTGTVGVNASLVVTGNFVQFDTWRPVPKPDNSLVLVCRTPVGEHDTATGLTHLSLWTITSRGTGEHQVVKTPATNGFGWVSYGHPEWSPDGHQVAVWVETSTQYKLMLIDADGFGR